LDALGIDQNKWRSGVAAAAGDSKLPIRKKLPRRASRFCSAARNFFQEAVACPSRAELTGLAVSVARANNQSDEQPGRAIQDLKFAMGRD